METKHIRLTPKGIAMCIAVENGLFSSTLTDEEMSRFSEFWRRVEGEVIPEFLRQKKEAEACEAPVPGMG